MWWGLHQSDGVEDVTDVVAEMKNGISYDGLRGGNASRQQRQCSGKRQRRLQLLDRKLLQSETTTSLASARRVLFNPGEAFNIRTC